MKPNPDLVDEAVVGGDDERLVDSGGSLSSAGGQRRQHRVAGPSLVSGDGELRGGGSRDHPVLRATGKTAAQMFSGESVLDALLHAGAVGSEGNRVAVMADKRVDVGLRGGDALGFGEQARSAR